MKLNMNIKSLIIVVLIVATLISCSNSDNNTVKNNSLSKVEENKPDSIVQDSTTILGDKIIWSPSEDLYGIASHDTIYLIKEFNDSTEALSFIKNYQIPLNIIPNEKYFYLEKKERYTVYSVSKPNIPHEAKVIHKIRTNNFHDDILLDPEQLKNAYRYYNVQQIEDDNVYVITQKKTYNQARLFSRLIKFDNNSVQTNAITVNDFELTSYNRIEEGYILGLNDFCHGASFYYFSDEPYSCKVLFLNNDLKIIGDYHAHLESTHLVEVNQDEDGIYAAFELHLSCDECFDAFCTYAVYFDATFNPKSVKIIEQPSRGEIINPDALLHCIINKISFPDYWYSL